MRNRIRHENIRGICKIRYAVNRVVLLNIKEYTAVIVRIPVICIISSLLYISLKLLYIRI